MEEDIAVIRERAQSLARSTRMLMRDLVQVRKDNDDSQNEIALRMDMTQAAVSQLERHDANPTLSTIQRYALAVGARLEITVINERKVDRVATATFTPQVVSPRRSNTDWSGATVLGHVSSLAGVGPHE